MTKALHRSSLRRLFLTTALPLLLLAGGAREALAACPVVVGANGANGADGVGQFDPGQPGSAGEIGVADAGYSVPNAD